MVTITINNLSVSDTEKVEVTLDGMENVTLVEANIVTGSKDSYNTVDNPEQVKEEKFEAVSVAGNQLSLQIPPCSVVEIRVK